MKTCDQSKVNPAHFERLAVVYVRQSTPQQVLTHQESAEIQYRLSERAEALGWKKERVLIIDDDLGVSGSSAVGRVGFQRLLGEISLQHVGIVLGVEMSRLARSCQDWYQLLELCAVFGTLLADNDGVYDPSVYNDRLLLGLKGTISEAELHLIRNRLVAGKRNKAMKGTLHWPAPIGYILTANGLVKDPDEQVRSTVTLIFEEFERHPSLNSLLQFLWKQGIQLGVRCPVGEKKGDLEWHRVNRSTIQCILHNPTYAGAYVYGRRQIDAKHRKPGHRSNGKIVHDMNQWIAFEKGKLPAYITWERFMQNQERLRQNQCRMAAQTHPRPGRGLLTGIAICGHCGHRMYTTVGGRITSPRYACIKTHLHYGQPRCQSLPTWVVDKGVEDAVLEVLKPATISLALEAQQEIEGERQRLRQNWELRMERARIECERARRQYDKVEPENRLVARELERHWEEKLIELRNIEEAYERKKPEISENTSALQIAEIRQLSSHIPELWRMSSTTIEMKKEIVRLLIEEVVLDVLGKTENVRVVICWQGGRKSTFEVRRPVKAYEQLSNWREIRELMERLRALGCSSREIADRLNMKKYLTPKRVGKYSADMVRQILSRESSDTSRNQRPRDSPNLQPNEYTVPMLSRVLGIPSSTIYSWIQAGWILYRHQEWQGKQRVILQVPQEEMERIRRLREARPGWSDEPYPKALTTPLYPTSKKEKDHAAQEP